MRTRHRLIAWRKKAGFQQKEAARRAKIQPSKWSGIESGTRLPNLEQAFRIAELTEDGIPADAWIGEPIEVPPRARRRAKKAA